MLGTITAVNAKGFGFIKPNDGGKDLFFHRKDLAEGLEFDERLTEMRVEFDSINAPKGPCAANVRPAP